MKSLMHSRAKLESIRVRTRCLRSPRRVRTLLCTGATSVEEVLLRIIAAQSIASPAALTMLTFHTGALARSLIETHQSMAGGTINIAT